MGEGDRGANRREEPLDDGARGARARGWHRRTVLRALGGLGTTVAGVPTVGRAERRGRDGVPVVWTRRPDGTPERVRTISSERRRRLRVYRDLDVAGLVREYEPLLAVSASPGRRERPGSDRDGDGLALALHVERASRAVRRRLPDALGGVPTEVVERAGDQRPTGRSRAERSTRTCADRMLSFHDPLVGGIPVHPKRDDAQLPDGTAGVVCWDADDGDICLLTAAHVAADSGEFFEDLYHDGMDDEDRYREERVARRATHSLAGDGGVDVAKFRVVDGTRAGPLASVGRDHPDVTGSWDFEGLADATAAGAVPVSFAGRSTCYAESECVGTFRSALVDYAILVRPGIAVAGDSGGAFLDERGRLVGLFTHHNPSENSGPVGSVALDRVEARLSPMG